MTNERLEEILKLANFQKIETEVVSKEKYFDMRRHPILKEWNFVPIFQSESYVSVGSEENYKYSFTMGFADDVKEYPNHKFIWLQVNKYDKRDNIWLIHILRMYAKEKDKISF